MNNYPKLLKVIFPLAVFLFFMGIPRGNAANNQEAPLAKEGVLRANKQDVEKA